MSSPVNIILGVLGAQGVMSAIDGVKGSLGGLTTTILGTASAAEGLKTGLDLGGTMVDLKNRTGQAIRDMVVFNRALDTTGVGAANAAQFIGLLQKSIAGLNEDGQATGDVFKRLGLDPNRLKQMGITDQVRELSAAFDKFTNPAERSALAMQLFGRSGAQMLQLLGDSNAMASAERDAGRLGDRLEKDAAQFDDLGDRLSIAKIRLQEFWVVAAEKAVPILQVMAELLESINPAPLAAAAGSVAGIFAVAGGLRLVEKLNTSLWSFATNPEITGAAQTFAQRFLAPMSAGLTSLLTVALPIAVAGLIAAAILQGVAQAMQENIAEENAKAEASARASQRQRDALRNAKSLAEVETQRKAVLEDIAKLQEKANGEETVTTFKREAGGGMTSTQTKRKVGLDEVEAQRLTELQRLLGTLDSQRASALVAQNQTKAVEDDRLTKAKEIVAELKKQADSYSAAAESARYALANDKAKLPLLDQALEKAEAQFKADTDAARLAGDVAAERAAQEKYDAEILTIAKQRKDTEKSIADTKQRQVDATAAALEKEKQAELELLRTKADIAKYDLEDRQLELQRKLNDLDADFTKTDAEKWADRKFYMAEAVKAARAYLDAMEAQRALAKTEAGRQLGDANVHSARKDLAGAEQQLAGVGPNPYSWVDQIRKSLTELRQEWGTTAQQIGRGISGTIGGAVNSLSSNLTGVIMRTQSLREAWNNVAMTIATNVVESLLQLGLRWLANQAMMAVGSKTIAAASAAATIPIAAAQAAIWSAPATLASIATLGAADVVGVTALQGALATSQALAMLPGFYDGGYTGESGGIVHRREFVFSAPAVRNIGRDRLEAFHDAAKGGGGSMGGGGSGGSAKKPTLIIPVYDMTSAIREMRRHPDHEAMIVDVMQRRKGELLDS